MSTKRMNRMIPVAVVGALAIAGGTVALAQGDGPSDKEVKARSTATATSISNEQLASLQAHAKDEGGELRLGAVTKTPIGVVTRSTIEKDGKVIGVCRTTSISFRLGSTGCGTPASVAKSGLIGVTLTGPDTAIVSGLVPDGTTLAGVENTSGKIDAAATKAAGTADAVAFKISTDQEIGSLELKTDSGATRSIDLKSLLTSLKER